MSMFIRQADRAWSLRRSGAYPGTMGRQLQSIAPALGLVAAGVAAFFAVAWLLSEANGVSVGDITRDAVAVKGYPVYVGLLSDVGAVLWFCAGAICFFAAGRSSGGRALRLRTFLYASGWISVLLAGDDFFLLHDKLLPQNFGIDENLVYASYAVMMVCYLSVFRNTIARTDFLLLAVALGCFALSLGWDFVYPDKTYILVEDGAKFGGILAWLAYVVRVAGRAVSTGFCPADSRTRLSGLDRISHHESTAAG